MLKRGEGANENRPPKREAGFRQGMPFELVPLAGVEPARCCHRQILSLLRLPIPPQRQDNGTIIIWTPGKIKR